METPITLYDLCGFMGVALSIYCYARVQWQRDYAKQMGYSALNLLGCGFYLISLSHNWNLPAVTSNCIWALLSLYGMYRCAKYIRREKGGSFRALFTKSKQC
jgi:hypothetical protein